jgi:small subunit ribosomal protein S17e
MFDAQYGTIFNHSYPNNSSLDRISKVYVTFTVLIANSRNELSNLGKVRTDTVKRTSRELIKRFPERFTGDFESDKQAVNDLVDTQSKRLRNRIAGYVTRLKVVEAERIAATQMAAEGTEPAQDDVAEE